MNYIAHYRSPIGDITLSCDGEAITGLWFDGQKHFMATLTSSGKDVVWLDDARLSYFKVLRDAFHWLDVYFTGLQPGPVPLLRLTATPFRRRVWGILRTIPYGQTITYGQIARQLGTRSFQAVGGAVGHNPISLFIPCHRVIGANGDLTGYDAGLERKRWLLELERGVK